MSELTVGIDIGTSSVKAVAADPDGRVAARARVPIPFRVPTATRFEHDPATWRRGPLAALEALGLDEAPLAVAVSAMVPSLAGVRDAEACTPGLLYGDERGRDPDAPPGAGEAGEALRFLRWCARACPDATGFWPAQAAANHALGGEAVLDTTAAAVFHPLFDWSDWNPAVAAELGVDPAGLPRLVPTLWEAGRVGGPDGPALGPGCVDALCEQIVAGADEPGDVLVILGTTLITYLVSDRDDPVDGLLTLPHTTPGRFLVGGPSNAGGLFCDWVRRLAGLAHPADGVGDPTVEPGPDPAAVPVWAPYPRGERVPFHDPHRRAELRGADLTHGPAHLLRAAWEASAFAARRITERAAAVHGVAPRRVVATGGGVRAGGWLAALADTTGLVVEAVAVPEGAALGAAFLARAVAGREQAMADARRWARTGAVVEPDARWADGIEDRYRRFCAL